MIRSETIGRKGVVSDCSCITSLSESLTRRPLNNAIASSLLKFFVIIKELAVRFEGLR